MVVVDGDDLVIDIVIVKIEVSDSVSEVMLIVY